MPTNRPTPQPIPGNGPTIAGSPWLLDDEHPTPPQPPTSPQDAS